MVINRTVACLRDSIGGNGRMFTLHDEIGRGSEMGQKRLLVEWDTLKSVSVHKSCN